MSICPDIETAKQEFAMNWSAGPVNAFRIYASVSLSTRKSLAPAGPIPHAHWKTCVPAPQRMATIHRLL